MDRLRKRALLTITILFLCLSTLVSASPGDILSQFSINNVSGDGRSPLSPQGVAYYNGYLWVLDFGTDRIYRVYPETVYDDDEVSVLFEAGDSDLNLAIPDVDNPPINSDGNAIGSCFSDANGDPQYCGGGGLTVAENFLWNASAITDDIIKLDPVDGDNLETENALANLAFPAPTDMAYDGLHFWIMDWQTNTVNKVLPEDGSVLDSISGPSKLPSYVNNPSVTNARPFGVTWDGRALWISDRQEDKIFRVDPQSGNVIGEFSSPGSSPNGLSWDGDALWHVDPSDNMIYKLDPGITPIGLVGCIDKNGRGFDGEILLSQPAQSAQIASTDDSGCFLFSEFKSGSPIQMAVSELGVNEAPVIILNEDDAGATSVTLVVGDFYSEPGYVAMDGEDGDISFDVIATPDVINVPALIDTSEPTTYTVSYDVVDSSGNRADTAYRRIDVLEIDIHPPVITLMGDNPILVEMGSNFIEPGANAFDERDGDVSASIVITGTVDMNTEGIYSLFYDVSDEAGNHAETVVRTVLVRDTTPPVLTLFGSHFYSLEKGHEFVDPGAVALDNIDGNISSQIQRHGAIENTVGRYILSYEVTDSSGNKSNIETREINVADSQRPVITLFGPLEITTELDEPFIDPGARAIDSPSEDLSANIIVSGAVDITKVGSYTLNYDVVDDSGNTAATVSRVITVLDKGPVISIQGANPYNQAINTPFTDPGATAYDSTDGDLSAQVVTQGSVNVTKLGRYLITYNVSDAANNPAPSATRVVNVIDSIAPVITLIGDASINIELGDSFTDPGATAFDDGDGNLSNNIVTKGRVKPNNVGNYVLKYNVADSAGNKAIEVHRTVIVSDTFVPVITLNGELNVILKVGQTYNDLGATAYDQFDGNLEVVTSGSVNVNAEGSYVLHYDATDSSGKKAVQVNRSVKVVNGPLITLNGGAILTHQIGTDFVEPGVIATDPVDGDITHRLIISGSVDSTRPGYYTLKYNVMNLRNIPAEQVIRAVLVTDLVGPLLTLQGDATMALELGDNFVDPGAIALDTRDGNLSGDIVREGSVRTGKIGTYVLTYNVQDSAGNQAPEVSRTVIISDSEVPVITLNGKTNIVHTELLKFNDPGATAFDSFDGLLPVTVSGSVNGNVAGTYVLRYDASDSSGQHAEQLQRTVKVLARPVISLIGGSTFNHQLGTPFEDPGVNASDAIDGDLSSKVRVSGRVDSNSKGSYTLRYSVSNSNNIAANQELRRVKVGDAIIPVITLVGAPTLNISQGVAFNDPGAIAIDNVDGDITGRMSRRGEANPSEGGSYTLRYNVTDLSGNSANQVFRIVNVTDITPPVLSLNGPAEIMHEAGKVFNDSGATAIDPFIGDVSSRIRVSGSVDEDTPGDYTLVYSVSDSSGNSAPSMSRHVSVSDTQAPTITLRGSATLFHEQGFSFNDPGANATDFFEGNISSQVSVSGSVNTAIAGTYTLSYSVNDSAGNAAPNKTRTVIVSDQTQPNLSLQGESSMSIVVGTTFVDPGFSAIDRVDGDVSSSVVITGSVDITTAGSYELTYAVKDAAGNSSEPRVREVSVIVPSPIYLEAEEASFKGNLRIRDRDEGYRGSGYVQTNHGSVRPGDYLKFRDVEAHATPYQVAVRYSGKAVGLLEVRLNDNPVGTLTLASTGDRSNWLISTSIIITPREGENELRLVILNKESHIDQLIIQPTAFQ